MVVFHSCFRLRPLSHKELDIEKQKHNAWYIFSKYCRINTKTHIEYFYKTKNKRVTILLIHSPTFAFCSSKFIKKNRFVLLLFGRNNDYI
ncbi:hypothetical protein ES319_D10G162900v1 [Gossypium barbadense]|uniref:Uncharacterized protein n=2 Tax=Gossypium TaxID=3633 RepID=A0A5J5PTU6_GOSBA|nr:hypothetical protein ES319_D10G162900v1 [Gossypium barbadense]TYH50030.1 hypothetical protein ES332_D10G176400v1 [Gossypium tomentosum]